jgi:hypothetical protein
MNIPGVGWPDRLPIAHRGQAHTACPAALLVTSILGPCRGPRLFAAAHSDASAVHPYRRPPYKARPRPRRRVVHSWSIERVAAISAQQCVKRVEHAPAAGLRVSPSSSLILSDGARDDGACPGSLPSCSAFRFPCPFIPTRPCERVDAPASPRGRARAWRAGPRASRVLRCTALLEVQREW